MGGAQTLVWAEIIDSPDWKMCISIWRPLALTSKPSEQAAWKAKMHFTRPGFPATTAATIKPPQLYHICYFLYVRLFSVWTAGAEKCCLLDVVFHETGGHDGVIRLWDLRSGNEPKGFMSSHTDANTLNSMQVTLDTQSVLSISQSKQNVENSSVHKKNVETHSDSSLVEL